MNGFLTVEEGRYEYEISRSRFIGICKRVHTDAEATAEIAEIRRKYRDCTHVCYAYIADDGARSCDDGEPSGTAGVPIMECIRNANVRQTLVAVVRYFGGIKLGAGGLLRAYAHTASTALTGVGRVEVTPCTLYKVSPDYATWKKIEKRRFQSLYKIMEKEYNKTVDLTCAAIDDAFTQEWNAATQGKCPPARVGVALVEKKLQ